MYKDKIEVILKNIYEESLEIKDRGIVANYIPELGKANINDLSISLIDSSGRTFNFGEWEKSFTMQSVSKIISLIIAIEENGLSFVMDRVGFNGSPVEFNNIYRLDLPTINKPDNPMINAGAILTTSLIKGGHEDKFRKIIDLTSKLTGNLNIDYSKDVYLSEKETGDRNRSIGYILKAKGLVEGDVDKLLDTYFKQCSIDVTSLDLAKIGLVLSNRGRLLGGEPVFKEETARAVNSVMTMAGMYNNSGPYGARVGIPSKSGVSGGLLGLVPGKFGIGIYSPGLDEYGNTKVGCKVMEKVSEKLNCSIF